MSNIIPQELINFIYDVRWEYPFELHSNISLQKDLKITGDDAIEFIIAFGKEFEVDVSGFNADEYFESEGISLISIIDLFKRRKRSMKKEITLGDLSKAIEKGILM